MSNETPRTGLPLLAAAQAQKHVTHNEALLALDALSGLTLLDRDLATPPSVPADGDTYLVASPATDAWAGKEGLIAYAFSGGWRFYAPFEGLIARVADENRFIVFANDVWTDYAAYIPLDNVGQLGVNTAADSTNKFAVKSNVVLFAALEAASGGSGDVRFVINKETSGDTASLLFQAGFSGRAELGLAGDDNLHLKVSPDGAAWIEAAILDRTSGRITLVGDPTEALHAATKQYVDAHAGSGGGGDGGGAPTTASYLTVSNDVGLSAERVLTAGDGITFADAGAGSTLTIANDDRGSDALTTHLAVTDPHPQYLTAADGDAGYLKQSGGTLTGALTLAGDPSAALHAATKHYVDTQVPVQTAAIVFVIDGAGEAITTGIKGDVMVPFAATIDHVTLLADQSGSAVIDIWKTTLADYPPASADSITGPSKPSLSGAAKMQDTTLGGWTASITAGDVLRFNVDSAATITRLSVILSVTKA
ncbi:MAG: DUF2793 domain-containing protein [Alphaproteobacteria bacterium]|nr:DUF2793 domain-containing protein [Alphaproteobacteria bacterium]OJU57662.1 MAG: hypothetical protein BGO00_11050 [Alphaproteobacteria bacterium 62-8]